MASPPQTAVDATPGSRRQPGPQPGIGQTPGGVVHAGREPAKLAAVLRRERRLIGMLVNRLADEHAVAGEPSRAHSRPSPCLVWSRRARRAARRASEA